MNALFQSPLIATGYSNSTLTFYLSGTTTLAPIYNAAGLPLQNPLPSDAYGNFTPIYRDSTKNYRAVLKKADSSVVWDIDPANDGSFADALATINANGATILSQAQIYSEAALAAANGYLFFSTVDALSKGVISATSLVAGSGGTNGNFGVAFSGGGGSGAAATFTVAGGALTSIIVTSKGAGYASAPTMSFAASSGLSGASATAVIGPRTSPGDPFIVSIAGNLAVYKNDAGVAEFQGNLPSGTALDDILAGFSNSAGLAPFVILDVNGRPISATDSEGNSLDRNGQQIGVSSVYGNIAAALAATPGTPQALFNADMVTALAPQTLLRRPISVWDEKLTVSPTSAQIDSFRFSSAVDYDATHSYEIMSARYGAFNDNEDGMKLVGRPVTLDANLIPTPGALVDIDIPAGYTAGTGSSWNGATYIAGDYHHFWWTRFDGARYDIYAAYRRISSGAFSTPRLMLSGASAFTAFGLPDVGSGFQLVGVDPVIKLDNGRVVIIGFMPSSPKNYLASLWVDYATLLANPDTYAFTHGTALQYALAGHNEPTITNRQGGGGIVTVRDENTNARGIYTTADGDGFSYLREDTQLAFTNVANGLCYFADNVPVTLVAGSRDPTVGNRQQPVVYLCYGTNLTPMAVVSDLWDPAERIEYMEIRRGPNGNPRITFEHSSIGTVVSFNQRVGISWIEVSRSWLMAHATPL